MKHAQALAALLLALTLPAQASERCHQFAAMYQTAYSLRDSGLTDAQIVAQIAGFNFSQGERERAVQRVKANGDIGYLSAKRMYRHAYLECVGAP